MTDELVFASVDNVPTTSTDNTSNRWSFNFNPLSFLQRQENVPSSSEEAESAVGRVCTDTAITSPPGDDISVEPLLTSTPTE